MNLRKFFVGRAIGFLVVIVLVGGWWFFFGKDMNEQKTQPAAQDLGTYAYECDEHVQLMLTLASDMSSAHIAPVGGVYPPEITLIKKDAASGVRYEGSGFIFTAKGETLTLSEGDSAINCSPVLSQENAPFNFGD